MAWLRPANRLSFLHRFLSGVKGRLLAWAVVAAFLIPITMCGLSRASRPETYPGDRMETRVCRECSGQRSDCPTCAGKGKVFVITPGPNHPSWVALEVVQTGSPPAPPALTTEELLKPLPGGVGGARIKLEKDGKVIEVTTTFTGRTKVRLAPGKWSYTVSKPEQREVKGSFEIPVLTSEIWKSKGLSRKDGDWLEQPLRVEMPRSSP
ncbi:MAG: hypothetical protein AMXMBFR33_38720 [Candidatus Xenobia bacterium]